MLPFGVTIPAAVPQTSEIPEGLTNYPVFDGTSILPSQYTYVFCFTRAVNTERTRKPERHSLIGLCNGDGACFMEVKIRFLSAYLDTFHASGD
jgi:hypothetical protein